MKKRTLPLGRVYQMLEPGPVVLLTTTHAGKANIMTLSWHMMMEFEPPLIGCVISGRNHSFEMLRKSRECVINIPSVELADKVVGCGNTSGRNIDKFAGFGLTAMPAARVAAPLIDECHANLECRIADTRMVNAYNMFVLEVCQAWIGTPRRDWHTLHHQGMGAFMTAGDTLKLPSRMK